MSRTSFLVAVLVAWHLGSAGRTAAQQAWRVSVPGRPIAIITSPPLTPGVWYEIQSVENSPGDSVLSIAVPPASPTSPVTAVAGADDCATGIPTSACRRFYVNPALYSSPTRFWLIARAKTNSSWGTTELRIQRMPDGTSTSYGSANCVGESLVLGCWWRYSNVSFGGYVHTSLGTVATNVHYETGETLGSQGLAVSLWSAPSNTDPTTNWQLTRLAAGGTHRSLVVGAAEYQGPWVSGALVAGPTAGVAEPFALYRNDYGMVGPTPFGVDGDGDTLGQEFEHSILLTCDATSGPTLNGLSCASLQGCGSPTSELCRASLRDSDQDGFEDHLEVYGYQSALGLPTTVLPRMGASPCRHDVFVELDVGFNDTTTPFPTCTYNDAGYIDYREATQMSSVYRDVTMASAPNRCSSAGMHVHFDIPPVIRGDVAPPFNAEYAGVWGGATCIRTPECTSNTDCNFGGATDGVCASAPVGGGNRFCTQYNEPAYAIVQNRRWLFRGILTVDGGNGPGSPTPWLSGGGGGTVALGSVWSSAGGPGAASHELGHQGGLSHGGPHLNQPGSHLFEPSTAAGYEQNFKPNYYSRINYLYQDWGFVESTAWPTALPPLLPELGYVSYSEASTSVSVDPRAVREQAVFVGIDPLPFETGASGVGIPWDILSDGSLDWDFDLSVLASPATQETAVYHTDRFVRRGVEVPDTRWRLVDSPTGEVVQGSTLWHFRAVNDAPSSLSGMFLEVQHSATVPCSGTANTTLGQPRFTNCDFVVDPTSETLVTSALNPVRPHAFAAEAVAVSGGPTGALVVYVESNAGVFRWGVNSSGSSTLAPGTALPTADGRLTVDGSQAIALARIGGSQNFSLVYISSGGALLERVLTWSGTTPSWSAPVALPSTISSGLIAGTSPAMATVEGMSPAGNGTVLSVRNSVGQVRLYRRGTATGAGASWSTSASATITVPADKTSRGPVRVAIGRLRRGATDNWHVFLYALFDTSTTFSQTYVARSLASQFAFSGTGSVWLDLDNVGNTAISEPATVGPVFDARSGSGSNRGMRGTMIRVVGGALPTCSPACTGPGICCAVGETCTAVGSRNFCFQGSVPTGVISCTGLGNSGCPVGYTCSNFGDDSICVRAGYVATAGERRLPAIDGVPPGLLETANDWPRLRDIFCRGMRAQRPLAPGGSFPGAAGSYQGPVVGGSATATCFAAAVF